MSHSNQTMRNTGSIYKYKSRAVTVNTGENRVEDPRLYWLDAEAEKKVCEWGWHSETQGRNAQRERERTRNYSWKAKEECFTK